MKQRLEAWGDTKIIQIASVVAINESGQILLLQRHSQDLGGGMWGTPGGRLENNELALSAALRELYEETGIAIHEAEQLGRHEVRMPHGTVHMTTFKVLIPDETTITIDPDEHHAHKWFNIDDLMDEQGLLWGAPTTLRDFGLMNDFDTDHTLNDGTQVLLLV